MSRANKTFELLPPVLTKEQLKREMDYRTAINILQSLLRQGIITEAESKKIHRKIMTEFPPVWSRMA